MSNDGKVWSETFHVLRPVCVFLTAMAVVAIAMATKGWRVATVLLAVMLVLIGGLLVLQVHRAVMHLRRRSMLLREAALEAERHYVDVLRRIIRFVEARDKYGCGRSERVGGLAEQISRHLRLEDHKCSLMGLAGQLHDIGLIAVPEAILNRTERWGTSEFQSVQKHPEVSFDVLKPLDSLADVLPAIRHHHERMNGTGYPSGLAGQEIPLEARIIAVAEAFEAMTHDRPHRPGVTPLAAMRELRRCTPAGYDPVCVEALCQVIHLPVLQEQEAKA